MPDCLFCKIVAGKIPAKLVHQDEDTVAFEDINPQAPLHVLVIPRQHVASTMNELTPAQDQVMGKLYRVAAAIAKERGVAESGWRAVMNANRDAGQTVFHVHLHVLGGRPFSWPPG
jgi:histidine triad (HIT) family protein